MGSVNIGGTWKDLVKPSCNIGGTWKNGLLLAANIGGTWKTLWELAGELYLYNEGEGEDNWVEGYSYRDGSVSKESDHLKVYATSGEEQLAERTYVTDDPIDLTNYDTAYIDWKVGVSSLYSTGYFVASTDKNTSCTTYNTRVAINSYTSRVETQMDISGLTGNHYLRVHAVKSIHPFASSITVYAYKIWLE
jgi:hypothetical protein